MLSESLFLGILIDGDNHMKKKQFKCNECNFTIAKLNTLNTHMKRGRCLSLGRNRIILFLVNHMKKKRFKYKECNSRFVNLSSFNIHMEKQHYLTLHRNKITRFWSTVSVEPTTCKRKTI